MSTNKVPPSDQMRATGSARRKVALAPGRSQLDWVRNSATLPQARPRSVPYRELRKHRTKEDAWTAVHGRVFDITAYVEYHPGGIDMILAGAGKDATKLFMKYHAWVNPDFMLKRCYLGVLDMRGHDDESDEDDDDGSEDSQTLEEDGKAAIVAEYKPSSEDEKHSSTRQTESDAVTEDLDALRVAEIQE